MSDPLLTGIRNRVNLDGGMLSNYFVTADIKFCYFDLTKKNLNFLSNGSIIFFFFVIS